MPSPIRSRRVTVCTHVMLRSLTLGACSLSAWAVQVQSAAGGRRRRFANLKFRGRRLWSPAETDTLNGTDPEPQAQLGDGDSESATTTKQHAPGCDYDRNGRALAVALPSLGSPIREALDQAVGDEKL